MFGWDSQHKKFSKAYAFYFLIDFLQFFQCFLVFNYDKTTIKTNQYLALILSLLDLSDRLT